MTQCQETGEWITETIVTPTEQFIEEAVEKCREFRRRVERNVRRRVERDRQRREKKCREEKCRGIRSCFRKLVCWTVTIVERVVEYVLETIVEWAVETVCEIVMQTVKIIVDVVTTSLRFVVTGVACFVTTDWRGVLNTVIDFWFDIVAIYESLGELVDIGLGATAEFFEISSRFVRDIGEWFGALGRVVLGTIAGFFDAARQVTEALRDGFAGFVEAATSLGRLDFCGAAAGVVWGTSNALGKGIPAAITGAAFGAPRGIRDAFFNDAARERVRDMFEDRFGVVEISDNDVDVAARFADAANLDSRTWGVHWGIRPRRLSIPSRSDVINLRDKHLDDSEFDLYDIAGYAPIWRGNGCFSGNRWQVVYPGTDRRVRFSELRRYIEDGRDATVEFELVSMSSRILARDLKTAQRKFRTLGLHLDIEAQETMPVRRKVEGGDDFVIDLKEKMQSDGSVCLLGFPEICLNRTERFFGRYGLGTSKCVQPAVSVFQYERPSMFGLAGTQWPWFELPIGANETKEEELQRVLDETLVTREQPTGATYRDTRPDVVMGYVLAHELGHAFGLEHAGHDSLHYIMFVNNDGNWNDEFGAMLLEFLLLGGEPRFTLDNVVRVWEWIVQVAPDCLPEPQSDDFTDLA